jgi:hypothetical protein
MAYYAYDKNIGRPVYLPTADDFSSPLPSASIGDLFTKNLIATGNVNLSGAYSVTLPRIADAIDGLQAVIDRTNTISGTIASQNASIASISGRIGTNDSNLVATQASESTLATYINKPGYVAGNYYRFLWGNSIAGGLAASQDLFIGQSSGRPYEMTEFLSAFTNQELLIPSNVSTYIRKALTFSTSTTGIINSLTFNSPTTAILSVTTTVSGAPSAAAGGATVRGLSGFNGPYYDPTFTTNASGFVTSIAITNVSGISGQTISGSSVSGAKVDFGASTYSTRYYEGNFGWGGSTSWDIYQYAQTLSTDFLNAYPGGKAVVFLRLFENDTSQLTGTSADSRIYNLLADDGFTPDSYSVKDIVMASARRWVTFVRSKGWIPIVLTPVVSQQYNYASKTSFESVCNSLLSLKYSFPGTIVLDFTPSNTERATNMFTTSMFKVQSGSVSISGATSNIATTNIANATVTPNPTTGYGTVTFQNASDSTNFFPGNSIWFGGNLPGNNSRVSLGGFQNAATIFSVSGATLRFLNSRNIGFWPATSVSGVTVSTLNHVVTITTAQPHSFTVDTPALVRLDTSGSFQRSISGSPYAVAGNWTYDVTTVSGRFVFNSSGHNMTTGLTVVMSGAMPSGISGTALTFTGITVTSPDSWFFVVGPFGAGGSGTATATFTVGTTSSANAAVANGVYYPVSVTDTTLAIRIGAAANISGGTISGAKGVIFPYPDISPGSISPDGIHPREPTGLVNSAKYLETELRNSKLLFNTTNAVSPGSSDPNQLAVNPYLSNGLQTTLTENAQAQFQMVSPADASGSVIFPAGWSMAAINCGASLNLSGTGFFPYKNTTGFRLVVNGLAGRTFPSIATPVQSGAVADFNSLGFVTADPGQPTLTFQGRQKMSAPIAGFSTVSGSSNITLYFSNTGYITPMSAFLTSSVSGTHGGGYIANSGDSFVDGPFTSMTTATSGAALTPTAVAVSGQDVTWSVSPTTSFTVSGVICVNGFSSTVGGNGLNGFGIVKTINAGVSVIITMDSSYTPVSPTGTNTFAGMTFLTQSVAITRTPSPLASSTKTLQLCSGKLSVGGPTNFTNGFHCLGGTISGTTVTLKLAPTGFTGTSPMAAWGNVSGTTSILVTTNSATVANTALAGFFSGATWDSSSNTISYTATGITGSLVPPGTFVTRAIPLGSALSFTGASVVSSVYTFTLLSASMPTFNATPVAITIGGVTTVVQTGTIGITPGPVNTTIQAGPTNLGAAGTIQFLDFPDNSKFEGVLEADIISSNNFRQVTSTIRDLGVTGSTTNKTTAGAPVASGSRGIMNNYDGKTVKFRGRQSTVSLLEFPWVATSMQPFFGVQFGGQLGLNTPFSVTMVPRYVGILLS